MTSLETAMPKCPIQYLRELPQSWVFGALWMAALLAMALGAAQG